MLYDIRLRMHYDYDWPIAGGRHHARVMPLTRKGLQRVIAASTTIEPQPAERSEFRDFFGNTVAGMVIRRPHDALDIRMAARVEVSRADTAMLDVSPDLASLRQELAAIRSLSPQSPFHFMAGSALVPLGQEITDYAARSESPGRSISSLAGSLCQRIASDFHYDGEATDVATSADRAFALKRGVCQDFAHVMIAGLRGLGVPAGYVSGFLRTIPPPGKERLEGADAMHAWVRVWCGREAGWQEFDPTNAMIAGNDHITVGYGRDYSDVAPVVGVVKIQGGQEILQEVDVIPVDQAG